MGDQTFHNIAPTFWTSCLRSTWFPVLIVLLYLVSLILYQLFLSPLAKFPGPRLAAVSKLYEKYFDLVKGGRFTWEINRLHEQYGPIIRISPSELHIKDPDYYDVLYSGPTRKRDKDSWFSFIGYSKSIFSTEGHTLHRARRHVLGQFFSKRAILDLEPVMQANIQLLCRHFATAAECGNSLELHAAFLCFASDTLSQHAFGELNGFHYLHEPELSNTFKRRVNSIFELVIQARHSPLLCKLAHLLPLPTGLIMEPFYHVDKLESSVKRMVRGAYEQRHELEDKRKSIYPTILRNEKVPTNEKELDRLADDAIFLIIAGTDAPAQALAITMFHILNNPQVYRRLKDELNKTLPGVSGPTSLSALERLPYLTAVLKEGLRLSSIVTTRLPRIAPEEVLVYKEWKIPPGTPISMSTFFILRDPKIFPQPTKFLPERWLLDPQEIRKLEKYLVPFSKGTLGCLGPNLTWAWLYLVLGTLVRRFELVLHDTTEKNVEMTRDCFIGQTKQGLNNVKVKILADLHE